MTNCGTNDTLNLASRMGRDGSPDSAEQLSNNANQSPAGALMRPVLQVTETIITTTTFYSRGDNVLGDNNNYTAPDTFNKPDQQRSALNIPSMVRTLTPSRPTPAPHIDKELPSLPSDGTGDVSVSLQDGAKPTVSLTFPSSDHEGPTSTAFLARAALMLSSPALGFVLEQPFRQSMSQRGSGAPGPPTLPASSSEPITSLSYSTSVEASSTVEPSPTTSVPDGDSASRGSTFPLRPRSRTGSRGLLRSRSMYGRVVAVHENNAPKSEFDLSPRSSTIDYGHLPINSVELAMGDDVGLRRFWKLPFRNGTIKSSSHRPRTSDGTPVVPRGRLHTTVPSPIDVNTDPVVAATANATSTRPTSSTATERDVTFLPPKPIRRAASAPKLAPGGDALAARRRSVSLFQRRQSREPLPEHVPSQSAFGFQEPHTISSQKPSPLLRKLSRTLLGSSKPTSPDVRDPFLYQSQSDPPPALLTSQTSDETPEAYIQRMTHSVNPAEIAGILAARQNEFFSRALSAYMRRFNFRNQPLDVALRLLLLEAKLPHESQQIDRILGAFAQRYEECNSQLYSAPDAAYILAYSLVLLHSDAFNKANKMKMQKDQYVRNTRFPGIHTVILEYFYDNITAQPFRLATDHPEDIGQHVILERHLGHPSDRALSSSSAGLQKNDVYDLIEQNTLHTLRVHIQDFMPSKSPFKATFSRSFPEVLECFEGGIEVRQKAPSRRKAPPSAGPGAPADNLIPHRDSFRIIKAGVLRRREDMLLGNQKSRHRQWKNWTTVLTTSQLLFFRGVTVMMRIESFIASGASVDLTTEPDDVVSLQNAFSVREEGLSSDTFRFVSPSRHQYILQAGIPEDADMWITLINYASVFRTSGLQMRTKRARNGRDSVALSGSASSSAACTGSKALSRDVHEQGARHSISSESPSLHQHPRSVVTRAKLGDVLVQTERSRAALASEMRQIRNLVILTPLRKSTRDRIVAELKPLARRVKQLRLQIQKLECEREVLGSDLISFEEEIIPGTVFQPEQSPTDAPREPSLGSRRHPADSPSESDKV